MADFTEDTMPHGSVGAPANFLRSIPLSRWLLFAGSLGALLLAFIPWLTETACIGLAQQIQNGCYNQLSSSLNPFTVFVDLQLRFEIGLAHVPAPLVVALVPTCIAPGLVCSIWVRGPIRSTGQRIGLGVFSLWFLLLVVASIYTPLWVVNRTAELGRGASVTWGPGIGIFLVVPVLVSLWIGLLLTWRDLLRRRDEKDSSAIQRLSIGEYIGAGLVSVGVLVWFIAYYGLYWLLPPDCPPTPLFGEAPCNNRFGSGEGLDRVFLSPNGHEFSTIVYGIFTTVIVFGGFALLVALWLRHTSGKELIGIGVWIFCLLLLTGLSIYGTTRIVPYSGGDVWTSGVWVTLLGILLIAGGLVARWRLIGSSQARHVL